MKEFFSGLSKPSSMLIMGLVVGFIVGTLLMLAVGDHSSKIEYEDGYMDCKEEVQELLDSMFDYEEGEEE